MLGNSVLVINQDHERIADQQKILERGLHHMKKNSGILLGVTAVSILAVVGVFAGIAARSGGDDGGERSFSENIDEA
jgi:hypothetical protein